jgi:hypothetical protein
MNMNATDYARDIKAAWTGGTASILDACKQTADAYNNALLPEVEQQLAGVIAPSTLRKLVVIGNCLPFYDGSILPRQLPPHWGTLYELAKYANRDITGFSDRCANGSINAALERSTVQGWTPPKGKNGGKRQQQQSQQPVDPNAPVVAPVPGSGIPETLEGAIDLLGKLRTGGKPSAYAGQVKPGALAMAIKFLQAIADAGKGSVAP